MDSLAASSVDGSAGLSATRCAAPGLGFPIRPERESGPLGWPIVTAPVSRETSDALDTRLTDETAASSNRGESDAADSSSDSHAALEMAGLAGRDVSRETSDSINTRLTDETLAPRIPVDPESTDPSPDSQAALKVVDGAGSDVSRETSAKPAAVGRQHTSNPSTPADLTPTVDPPHEADDIAGKGVSRETSGGDDTVRAEVAAALPDPGEDTPLAQAVASDALRRIQLSGVELPRPASTRIMTVANQKGGVGKTTTAVNIAAALAQAGSTVLVVDLDPQGNASTALGIPHHAEVPSVYDVIVDSTPLADVVQSCPDIGGLVCAPATIDLAGAEIELVSLVARESRLSRAVAAYAAHRQETGDPLDYVLIDCPPSLGLLTVNAFVAASEVFIPIQCEYYALEGLSQLLKNIEMIRTHLNPELAVSTILLTMYDARTRLSAQVAQEVRTHFPAETLRATVPRSVRISEAPSHGQTVMTYDRNSSGALSYLEAATEMARRWAERTQGDNT